MTSFVGRETELARLAARLAPGRCVTLVGTGGVGKTRLALELARARLSAEDHEIWLVDLARLSAPDPVAAALASVLGVREERDRPLAATVAAALADRSALVLFDNCDRVAAACAALVDELVDACPRVEVLATSRVPLRAAREEVHRVAPLAVDAAGDESSEAARLFADRARFASPAFALTPANRRAVAEICRRLDGLPLAVELAAACARLLAPEQLVARLDDRFRLLGGAGRAQDERHRTLRAALDWSYDLLSDDERTTFARVSVFARGFSGGAARAICSGDGVDAEAVATLVDRLVDTSLAYVEPERGRYRMLDTVWEYARERLVASGEAGARLRTHRDWFLALAERARDEIAGAGQATWLDTLEVEADNLGAALAWTLGEAREPAEGLRFVGALYRFWELHGRQSEGRRWAEQALALAGGSEPALEAEARFGLAILAFSQSDYERTRDEVDLCLEIRRRLGDSEGVARALNLQSLAADFLNDFETAVALQEESLALSRELGLAASVNQGTYHLGLLALRRGDLDRAAESLAASVDGWRGAGNRIAAAGAEVNLAEVLRLRADLGRAREVNEAALAVAREAGATPLVAACLAERGQIASDGGATEAAVAAFREAAALYRETGSGEGLLEVVEGLALLAARCGDEPLATTLEAAALAGRAALPAPRDPIRQREIDAALAGFEAAAPPPLAIDEALELGLTTQYRER